MTLFSRATPSKVPVVIIINSVWTVKTKKAQIMRRRRPNQLSIKPAKAYILGKAGVGKSALIVRFMTRRFIGEYARAIEGTYKYHIETENEEVELEIADTAGENTAEKLSLISRRGDIFIILYSITDRSSFEEAKRIARFVKDSTADSVAIAIVANKCDLEHFRRVKYEEGESLSMELNCAFHEVTTSEDNKQAREVVQKSVSSFIRSREKMKDSGNLKVPSFVKRTPSFEKSEKKKRLGRFSQDSSKTLSRPFEFHTRMRRIEEGDGEDYKVNNNNNNNNRISNAFDSKNNDRVNKKDALSSEAINRTQGPFNVEKVKSATSKKLHSPTEKTGDYFNDDKPKIPFTVHKVKGSSAGELKRPLPVDKLRSRSSYNWTENSVSEEKPKQSSKGPFSLDRLRSQSTEKLRPSSSSDRPKSSTSSFTRMKDGLMGRTKALRRKPIYL